MSTFLLRLYATINDKLLRTFSLLTAEPDLYSHFNVSVSGPQLAKDFEKLKSLVTEKSPATKFIAGPDVAGIVEFFARYRC